MLPGTKNKPISTNPGNWNMLNSSETQIYQLLNKLIKQNKELDSPGNWSMLNPAIPFTTIYSQNWNNEFQNVINNSNPDGLASASETIEAMQAVKDPFPDPLGNPVTNESLRGDIEEIRFQLRAITGENYWYMFPEANLKNISTENVTGGNAHNHLGLTTDPTNGGGAPINTGAILDNAIIESKIATNSVTTTKIEDLAVIESKIAIDAISTDKIKDQSVTRAKINNSVFTNSIINFQYDGWDLYHYIHASQAFIPLTFYNNPTVATYNSGYRLGSINVTPKKTTNKFLLEAQVLLSNVGGASHLVVTFADETAEELLALDGTWNNDWGPHIITLRKIVSFPDITTRSITLNMGTSNQDGTGDGTDLQINYIVGAESLFTITEIEI